MPIYVKPLVAGNLQPSKSFNYTFNFTTNADCSGVLFSNDSEITTDQYGIGFIDLDISSLTQTPSYLCEYRNGALRKAHTLSDQIFKTVFAETLKANSLNISQDANIYGDIHGFGNLIIEGNMSIKRPYGMFSSTQDQIIAVAETAYPITFNWTEDVWEITKSSDNSNFTVQVSGDYFIELSAIVVTDTNNKHIEVWLQINGVNVPRSSTRLEIENAGTEQVIAVPFILDMDAGDTFRVMYASDDAGSTLQYTASHGTGANTVPECPSIIMTITKISEITD